jgi:DnaJ family protein C protein 2
VNPSFLAYARRKRHSRTFSEDERHLAEQRAHIIEDDADDHLPDEPENPQDLGRKPEEWRTQDNYRILGLSALRYKATEKQVRAAHLKRVLKHHPDKKADKNDDAFFKCISKAFEVLTDPVKRRQYDSVDFGLDHLDREWPSKQQVERKEGNFFKLWSVVFERESRFSNKRPTPSLGNYDTPRAEVEAFYDFWYNFDSWRSFEYLDKEDVGSADNRDDKRYQEKKNKTERARLKRDDNARVRSMVDRCLEMDPRIKKFKEEDKTKRNAKKNAAAETARKNAEEAAKKAEEERLAKEKAEAEAKTAIDNAKRDKEAVKRAIKKEKKTIKSIIKDNNYALGGDVATPSADQVEEQLTKLDGLLEKTKTVESLELLRKKLEAGLKDGELKVVFEKEVSGN